MTNRQKIEMTFVSVGALTGLGFFLVKILPLHLAFLLTYLCVVILMAVGAGIATFILQCALLWRERQED